MSKKSNMTDANKFSPVAFDPKGYAAKRRKTDTEFAVAYDEVQHILGHTQVKTTSGMHT